MWAAVDDIHKLLVDRESLCHSCVCSCEPEFSWQTLVKLVIRFENQWLRSRHSDPEL